MTQPHQDAILNGDALRLAREAKQLSVADLAIKTCMSSRQIRQLEEGETSSFYSLQVKLTAAKRVADVLGMKPEALFIQPHVDLPPEPEVPRLPRVSSVAVGMVSQAETDALVGMSLDNEPVMAELPAVSEPMDALPIPATPALEATSSKLSVWFVVALFVVALGVAALMRPASSPSATSEESAVASVPPEQEASDQMASDPPALTPSATPAPTTSVTPALRPAVATPASSVAPASPKPIASASAAMGTPDALSAASAASSKAP